MYAALDILKKYTYLGERLLENGTQLIGRAPHIAPQAWLHKIYSPLKDEELVELENILSVDIPETYKEFLRTSNGIGVFNTTFSLYGLRKNYRRDLLSVWQPFNILTPNIDERPVNARKDLFFIGGYDWDGSMLYIDKRTEMVHICREDDSTSLGEWVNFDEMFDSEINRLVTLFDDKGKEYDEDKSTLPF